MSRKQEKVTQIIMAATQELSNKSLDAASMHNIAELAGVSKRTLYKYFPSKENLYDAMIDYILDGMEQFSAIEYNPDLSLEEQIVKIIDIKISFSTSDDLMKIMKITLAEILKGRMIKEENALRINENELRFIKWIEAAKADGKITSDLSNESIANQFQGVLKGQVFWPVLMGMTCISNLDLEKIKEETKDFFLKNYCS